MDFCTLYFTMAVDECTKFLMDAVPLPESLAEDCAHFKVHNITICKGATRDTHDKIAVWTVNVRFLYFLKSTCTNDALS
jgi:hypothetical protein